MNHHHSAGFLSDIGKFWCRLVHRKAMWPIHGRYQCSRCLRYHEVAWENNTRNVKV